jgi:hypothetical protein
MKVPIDGDKKVSIPWIKINLGLYCKSKTSQALKSCNESVAPKEAISMASVIYLAVRAICQFYLEATDMSIEELNSGLKGALDLLNHAGFHETTEETTGDERKQIL